MPSKRNYYDYWQPEQKDKRMTKYIIHFFGGVYTEMIYAPCAETAMERAMEKYDSVSHVEEV